MQDDMTERYEPGEAQPTLSETTQQQESFLIAYGHAALVWAQVESTLCIYFRLITRMDSTMARRVFYSATGFRSRTRMLKAAIGCPTTNFSSPIEGDFVRKAIRVAESYCEVRNRIAHDQIVCYGIPGHPQSGQHVLVDGKYDRYLGDENPMTLAQLDTFHSNVSNLFLLLQLFVQREQNEGSVELAEQYLQMLQKLPNPPLDQKLNHSDAILLQSWTPTPFRILN